MKTVEELRQLADVLSKATPGPWVIAEGYWIDTEAEDGGVQDFSIEGSHIGIDNDDHPDLVAICAARNSEDAIRQAADELERKDAEIERLQSVAKIMATAIWYRHDTPESTITANQVLNDLRTKEARP